MSEGGSIDKIAVDPDTFEVGVDPFETSSTAYELIYIRKNQTSSILAPITEDQIPEYVKESVRSETEDYNKKQFQDNHIPLYLTSMDRIIGREGVGFGVDFWGVYDSMHAKRFLDNKDLCMLYLAEKKMTLEKFLEEIESRTNLRREAYQIYKYNQKTLTWIPFLVTQSLKNYQTKTLHELLFKDLRRILLIVPIIPHQRVFEPVEKEICFDFEDLYRSNKLTWFKNDLVEFQEPQILEQSSEEEKNLRDCAETEAGPESVNQTQQMFQMLKSYSASLVLIKRYSKGKVNLSSYSTISKLSSFEDLRKIHEITAEKKLYSEIPNRTKEYIQTSIELKMIEEKDENNTPRQVKDLSENVFTVVVDEDDDFEAITEFYENATNRCFVRISKFLRNLQSGEEVIEESLETLDLRLTTEVIRAFICRKFFPSQRPDRISISYLLESQDDPCDLLKPIEGVNTLKDMITDNNQIEIRLSQYSENELKENFEMPFSYVNFLGYQFDKSEELIPKSTTVKEYLGFV